MRMYGPMSVLNIHLINEQNDLVCVSVHMVCTIVVDVIIFLSDVRKEVSF